jgi:DnaJ-class molecular chaperone
VVSEEAAEVFVALKQSRIKVKLTLEEVANGVEKKVKVKRKVQAPGVSYKTCSTCNGQASDACYEYHFGRMQLHVQLVVVQVKY